MALYCMLDHRTSASHLTCGVSLNDKNGNGGM